MLTSTLIGLGGLLVGWVAKHFHAQGKIGELQTALDVANKVINAANTVTGGPPKAA